MHKLIMIMAAIAMMAISIGCTTNRYYGYRDCHGRPYVEPAPTVVYPPAPVVITPAPVVRPPVVNVFQEALPAGTRFFNPRVEYYGRGRQTIFHTRSQPAARVYYHQVEASPSAVENVQVIDATRVEY